MTEQRTTPVADDTTANSNFAVLAAIADLGMNATPAAIATKVGIAYSTVNPKLRGWEAAGLAERFRHDTGQTLWRLTDAGRASTATPPQFAEPDPEVTEPGSAEPGSTGLELAELGAAEQTASTSPPRTGAEAPVTPTDDPPESPPPPGPPAASSDTSAGEPDVGDPSVGDDADPDDGQPVRTAESPPSGAGPIPGTAEDGPIPDAAPGAAAPAAPPGKARRPKGALRSSALAVLQADPGDEFTIDEVKKRIDRADADTGYPQASHGAVSNALDKLEADGAVERIEDRKAATFRLTPHTD